MRSLILAAAALLMTAGAALATADGPDFFDVRDVAETDVLFLRDKPTANARQVGYIPHDGRGIPSLGCVTVKNGRIQPDSDHPVPGSSYWCRVQWGLSVGWANARYLTEGAAPQAPAARKATAAKLPSTVSLNRPVRSDYPPSVGAAIKERTEGCSTFRTKSGFYRNDVELNGDGIADWVLDYDYAECDGGGSQFCGTGGCVMQVLLSRGEGKWALEYSSHARGHEYVRKGNRTVMRLDLHGSNCGRSGADECHKDVDFSRKR